MSLLYAATVPCAHVGPLGLYGSYAQALRAPDYPFGWKDEAMGAAWF